MSTADFSPELMEKPEFVRRKLDVSDLATALDKSLNIAHFLTKVLNDDNGTLLVEPRGKFEQLTDFS